MPNDRQREIKRPLRLRLILCVLFSFLFKFLSSLSSLRFLCKPDFSTSTNSTTGCSSNCGKTSLVLNLFFFFKSVKKKKRELCSPVDSDCAVV